MFLDKCGYDFAKKFCQLSSDRADDSKDTKNRENYLLKNESLETSLTITNSFDYYILKEFFTWIIKYERLFGETILDVGCDCGVTTCFLGMLFPNSKIVGVDRCKKAVDNAIELANKLSLKNVTFINVELDNFIFDKFDTVISMRTLHENYNIDSNDNVFISYNEKIEKYQKLLRSYANHLSNLVKEDGVLISIERGEFNPVSIAWQSELLNNNICCNENIWDEISCNEIDEIAKFQVLYGYKRNEIKFKLINPIFVKHIEKIISYNNWTNWDADFILDNTKKDLIIGYKLFDPDNKQIGSIELWTNSADADSILFYYYNIYDKWILENHYLRFKDNIIMNINNFLNDCKKLNIKCIKM